ncbi:MAG TPA: glycosyltransferase family 4 protein [Bacteroidales bacterium]|nr:glycosyltransferase family 4 protein [Bacteroidales bacterium]
MASKKKLIISAILPHVELYGGIKRFFELGNQFINLNHRFIAFTPKGERPAWFSFQGEILPFSEMSNVEVDAIFFTELSLLPYVLAAKAKRKIFYIVNPSAKLGKIKKYPEIEFFTNSTNLLERAKRKYQIDAFPAFGGVNLKNFWVKPISPIHPNGPFTVLAYGRIAEGRKGTMYVVKACERLQRMGYDVRLLLFDTPVTEKIQKAINNFKTTVPYKFILNHAVEKNVEFFHQANFFVAPEKKTGFANTVAEAMASGIPVIATTSGTKDLLIPNKTGLLVTRNSYKIRDAIIKLLTNHNLCVELTKNARSNIEKLDWSILAANIIENLERTER